MLRLLRWGDRFVTCRLFHIHGEGKVTQCGAFLADYPTIPCNLLLLNNKKTRLNVLPYFIALEFSAANSNVYTTFMRSGCGGINASCRYKFLVICHGQHLAVCQSSEIKTRIIFVS